MSIKANELQILLVDNRKYLYLPSFDSRGYSQDNLKYDKEYLEGLEGCSYEKLTNNKLMSNCLAINEAYFNYAGTSENYLPRKGASTDNPLLPDFIKNLNPLEQKSLSEYWVYRQGVYSLRLKVSPGYEIHITYMSKN